MKHLRERLGDARQFASVRRIVLDDGPESGVRAVAFSTGGGLDFWVLTDRSLDIGPLWYRGCPLAWQSPSGFRNPALLDQGSDGGRGFDRGFSGLLVTCGLDHVRQPADGHPQHGRLPFTPGRVLACGEDWDAPEPFLYCEGEVVQARYGGENLRLRRRITAPIGGTSLRVEDVVENLGPEESPLALLYHVNFGYPAVGPGSVVSLADEPILGPIAFPGAAASREAACRPSPDAGVAECRMVTPVAGGQALRLTLSYSPASLPYLQVWHDLRPRVGVLALEPCTSDRRAGGGSGPAPLLSPGTSHASGFALAVDGPVPTWRTGQD
jgi:hypothetical protein